MPRPSISLPRAPMVAGAVLWLAGCAAITPSAPPAIAQGQKFPVFFSANAVAVDPAGAQVASQASVWAARYPSEAILVTGYVSPIDKPAAATYLATHRADAVIALLAADGVAPSRIKRMVTLEPVIGLGGTADRRVDIAVGM